jgi:putative endonuclease
MRNISTRVKGKESEDLALSFLESKGYKFIQRNFYCKYGEIDLIVENKDFIVFVEVKSINENTEFSIYETLTDSKKKKLKKAINSWVSKNNVYQKPWRLDFIGIVYSVRDTGTIEHFEFINI